MLNQVVRPFTAKWHGESLSCAFDDPGKREEFRYNRLLAKIADVEDLTDLESSGGE